MKNNRLVLLGLLGIMAVAACVLCAGLAVWLARTFVGEPPGQGPKAEEGYRVCAPVIEALERYRAAQGEYPTTLDALVPMYLGSIPRQANGDPIWYRNEGRSYQLRFLYTGPGLNECIYRPETGWKCSGHY